MRELFERQVDVLAHGHTKEAWYRGWRVMSIDGSTLAVPDEKANAEAFGYPGGGRGDAAFPQIRFVALAESGTHTLCKAVQGQRACAGAPAVPRIQARHAGYCRSPVLWIRHVARRSSMH
jgi:hypothetical protein